MDLEIAILAAVGASLLAGAAGVVWGRGTVENVTLSEPVYEPYATDGTLNPGVGGHVHEADKFPFVSTFDSTGWHCDCGKHVHVYSTKIEGTEEKRCICGEEGVGKVWA